MRPTRRTFLRAAGAALGAGAVRTGWGRTGQAAFDAIVVGGGAIGATTAYFLRRQGLSVALLDKGPAGREASWASAGMIQPHGSKRSDAWAARAALLSRELYDDLEPRLFEETGRRIGYGGEGGLILAFEEGEAESLRRLAKAPPVEDAAVRFLTGAEAREREPGLSDRVVAAALFPAHRFLDARTYTSVVVEAARKRGVSIREGTAVSELLRDGDRVVGVKAGEDRLSAGIVVMAAGAWSGKVDERLSLPVRPVHGQILSIEGPRGGLRHNLQRAGAGGYATPRADGRILVGATSEDFGYEKKVTPEGLAALAGMVRDLLPHRADSRVLETWSGLRPGSPDGLPAVGPDPRVPAGFLWATGHGGYGMMQGPATAAVVTDLVARREPRIPIASVNPARLVR
jgi:glycine oxidase